MEKKPIKRFTREQSLANLARIFEEKGLKKSVEEHYAKKAPKERKKP